MRGVRSLAILVAIGVLVGGYLYYDSKHEPSDAKKTDKVFDGVQAEKIDQVTVKAESGERATVRKQGDKWQVVQPAAAPADEATLSGITSGLAALDVQRVVDEQPTDLKQYGLDPARIEVDSPSPARSSGCSSGRKTPTGTDLYAKLPGAPRVFLVSSYLEATFNKTTFDLRDKTILKFDRDKVDHLDVQSPDRTLAFAKQGSDWRMTAPLDARADFGAVEGIARAAQHRGDEGDYQREPGRPGRVRPRPPGAVGARRRRQQPGGAADRQERRRRDRLRQGRGAADGLHRRIDAAR